MLNFMIKRLLILFLLSSFTYSVYAQQIPVSEYLLYTGKSYVDYPSIQAGTPTYNNYQYDTDTQLTYHGHTFTGRLLLYDLILDELVIFHPEKDVPLILPKGWVDEFVIRQDTFINLKKENYPGLPSSGYYRKFYNANGIECLASYSKSMRDEAGTSGRIRVVNEKVRYFIRTNSNDTFQEVSKLSQLLKLDPENRKKNRRTIYSAGMHTKARFGDAVLLVLSSMNSGKSE